MPLYPYPPSVLLPLAAALLLDRRRSFQKDAQACVRRLRPPLKVCGAENIPAGGPCLITINHYHRPGFFSAWITLPVSAVFPREIRWIITSAWTAAGPFPSQAVASASRSIFRRIAHVYGWTNMPPMPPSPDEVAARASAVRQIIAYTKNTPCPVIGLSPEGRDPPDGRLQKPPPGVGRFILHLAKLGMPVLPIGVFEDNHGLCLRFGQLYQLTPQIEKAAEERDREASDAVMRRIAVLLPPELRGEYH